MLPPPAASRVPGKPRIFFPPSAGPIPSPTSQILAALRTRTRLTNFAVLLISFALSVSLLLNLVLVHPIGTTPRTRSFTSWRSKVGAGWDDAATPEQHSLGIPLSIETTIDRDPRFLELNHLVMVPGHAIWTGHDASLIEDDQEWVLQPIQKGGSVKTFVKHIQEGVRMLKDDSKALLVFSGGATRAPPSPPLTEAYSYRAIADALGLIPSSPLQNENGQAPLPLNMRTTGEEFALDSYENLLFSIARFKEVTTRWPSRITVIGYKMKERRFTDLHRATIGFPVEDWRYIGIDDERDTKDQYAGELKYGYTPFLSSPSGCHPPLSIKRLTRNPFLRYHPYHMSCPELVDLLEWCPPMRGEVDDKDQMQVFEGQVPWRAGKHGWGRESW